MIGAMFGFETLGDYVKGMGLNNTGEATNTWGKNSPGTDYEIYVQAWDVNGTFADMVIIPVSTKNLEVKVLHRWKSLSANSAVTLRLVIIRWLHILLMIRPLCTVTC